MHRQWSQHISVTPVGRATLMVSEVRVGKETCALGWCSAEVSPLPRVAGLEKTAWKLAASSSAQL